MKEPQSTDPVARAANGRQFMLCTCWDRHKMLDSQRRSVAQLG